MTSGRQTHIAKSICFVTFVTVLSGPAQADEFCANVAAQVAQAEAGFVQNSRADALSAFAGSNDCGLSDKLGGTRSFHCVWEYQYRQPEAYDAFESKARSLKECFGNNARVRRDQPVNHPDFYDQVSFLVNDIEVRVSIKDKSALQRTFTFIRIDTANAD